MCDNFIGKVAKTSVDTVDDSFGIRHHFLDDLSTFFDDFPGFGSEIDFPLILNDVMKCLRSKRIPINVKDFLDRGGNTMQ
jgi:hypothetical protein